MKKTNIIVPVYADWASLRQNIKSLGRYYGNQNKVHIYYVNDCGPETDFLEKNIKQKIKHFDNIHYSHNKNNMGFLKNCNNAVFDVVKDKKADILLLNSDTKVTKGFLEEMQKVLYSEDNICAVSPRSNNATVFSVPIDASMSEEPKRSYKLWKKIRDAIPEKYICPTAHGFCMLIRRELIDQYGLFDEVYGSGYGEENDFTMRLYEKGYICAIANNAFVFHYESKSFGNETRERLIEKHKEILIKRYPEYNRLIQKYLASLPKEVVERQDGIMWRIIRKTYHTLEFGRTHGYGKTIERIPKYIMKELGIKKTPEPESKSEQKPELKIFTHEMSNTGAPVVLLDVLRQWQGNIPANSRIYYMKDALRHESFVERIGSLNIPMQETDIFVRFNPGDILLLNSSAYSCPMYDSILSNIENGTIRHMFWYIHEDSEKWVGSFWNFKELIPRDAEDEKAIYRYKNIKNRFHDLIEKDKITIYMPSSSSAKKWQRYFETKKNFFTMPGRVPIRKEDVRHRNAQDFDKINFIIAGSVEPHKMQLSVVDAVLSVANKTKGNKQRYRDFSLNIVGNKGNNENLFYDYSVTKIAEKNKAIIRAWGRKTPEETLGIIRQSNFTITYSMGESFSMVTMEGMAFGHPIIRSESSGRNEQLKPGINGWPADTGDFIGLVNIIEEIVDKEKTSNDELAKMSMASAKTAKQSAARRYRIIDDIEGYHE